MIMPLDTVSRLHRSGSVRRSRTQREAGAHVILTPPSCVPEWLAGLTKPPQSLAPRLNPGLPTAPTGRRLPPAKPPLLPQHATARPRSGAPWARKSGPRLGGRRLTALGRRDYDPDTGKCPGKEGVAVLLGGRREFLRVGGGLAAAGLLTSARARADRSAVGARPGQAGARSCILVYLLGGPPHLDMWDLKPAAPAEVRGPFRPIP